MAWLIRTRKRLRGLISRLKGDLAELPQKVATFEARLAASFWIVVLTPAASGAVGQAFSPGSAAPIRIKRPRNCLFASQIGRNALRLR